MVTVNLVMGGCTGFFFGSGLAFGSIGGSGGTMGVPLMPGWLNKRAVGSSTFGAGEADLERRARSCLPSAWRLVSRGVAHWSR